MVGTYYSMSYILTHYFYRYIFKISSFWNRDYYLSPNLTPFYQRHFQKRKFLLKFNCMTHCLPAIAIATAIAAAKYGTYEVWTRQNVFEYPVTLNWIAWKKLLNRRYFSESGKKYILVTFLSQISSSSRKKVLIICMFEKVILVRIPLHVTLSLFENLVSPLVVLFHVLILA